MTTLKQAKIASWLLGFLFAISFISGFIKDTKMLPNNWELPIILAALILIIQMLSVVFAVDEKTEKVLENLGSTNTVRYDRYSEFYEDLAKAVSHTKRSLLLTHIRHDPPSSFKLGQRYFDSIEEWCQSNQDGVVKRITTDSNDNMKAWIDEQARLACKLHNFYVRVCDWNATFPIINFAILDDKKVFLAISGEFPESTSGIQIDDPAIAKYFREYFTNLWSKGRDPSVTRK